MLTSCECRKRHKTAPKLFWKKYTMRHFLIYVPNSFNKVFPHSKSSTWGLLFWFTIRTETLSGPMVIKAFFRLNSAKHEIQTALKEEKKPFPGSDKLGRVFILLINVYKKHKFHAVLIFYNLGAGFLLFRQLGCFLLTKETYMKQGFNPTIRQIALYRTNKKPLINILRVWKRNM